MREQRDGEGNEERGRARDLGRQDAHRQGVSDGATAAPGQQSWFHARNNETREARSGRSSVRRERRRRRRGRQPAHLVGCWCSGCIGGLQQARGREEGGTHGQALVREQRSSCTCGRGQRRPHSRAAGSTSKDSSGWARIQGEGGVCGWIWRLAHD